MPRSVDFNWVDGEVAFDPKNIDQAQNASYQPPPHAQHSAPPAAAAARPAVAQTVPAPQAGRDVHGSDRDIRGNESPRQGGPRLGRLALLALGITLGMAVGLGVLSWQGQRNARADLAPVFVLLQQALDKGDEDLYGSLIDDATPDFRDALLAGQANTAKLFDAGGGQSIHRLRIQGDRAEVEVDAAYRGEPYRRLETLRLADGQWRFAQPDLSTWGDIITEETKNLTLHYYQRDARLPDLLPRLDAAAQAFCRRYNPPPPCHVELTITPDPALLPFRSDEGASPAPSLIAYQSSTYDDYLLVTLDATGREMDDPAFLQGVLDALPRVRDPGDILVLNQSAPDAAGVASERLFGPTIPLRVLSPHLVGVHNRDPHPLWWLGVTESIGDVIARRALGPVTGEPDAVLTAWAAARGDVAIWAERFTGVAVRLSAHAVPSVAHDEAQPASAVQSWSNDPAVIGMDLALPRGDQRLAARRFALNLHARFGESETLTWLRGLRGQTLTTSSMAMKDQTIDQLRQDWRMWVAAAKS